MSVALPARIGAPAQVGRMLAEHVRAQLLMFVRNVALSVASVVLPVMLYAFIGGSGGSMEVAPGVPFSAYFLASMAAYAVSAVMVFNFGVSVAVDRGQRADALIRVGPMPPAIYLVARVVTAFVFGILALLVLFAFAAVVVGVDLPVTTWFLLGGWLLVGAFPFIALGFAIAYLAGPNAAVAIANITYLGLAFTSGLFIQFESLPAFVQTLAPFLPTYHYAQLAWGAVGVPVEGTVLSLGWLTGYGLAFLLVAAWAYRREETRAFR